MKYIGIFPLAHLLIITTTVKLECILIIYVPFWLDSTLCEMVDSKSNLKSTWLWHFDLDVGVDNEFVCLLLIA